MSIDRGMAYTAEFFLTPPDPRPSVRPPCTPHNTTNPTHDNTHLVERHALEVEVQQVLVHHAGGPVPVHPGRQRVVADHGQRALLPDLRDLARHKLRAGLVGAAHLAGHVAVRGGAERLDAAGLGVLGLLALRAVALEHGGVGAGIRAGRLWGGGGWAGGGFGDD